MRQKHETRKRAKLTAKNGGCVISFSNFQKVQCGCKCPKESLLASLEDFKEKSAFLKRTQTLKKSKGAINA